MFGLILNSFALHRNLENVKCELPSKKQLIRSYTTFSMLSLLSFVISYCNKSLYCAQFVN